MNNTFLNPNKFDEHTNCTRTTLLTGAKYLEKGRATNLAGLDILIPECLPGWRVLLIYRLGLQPSKLCKLHTCNLQVFKRKQTEQNVNKK